MPEPPSFEEVAEAAFPSLRLVAEAFSRDPDTAQDIVQDAMIRVWRRSKQAPTPRLTGQYLQAAVVNEALNWLRACKRRAAHQEAAGARLDSVALHSDELLLEHRVFEAYADAVAALPPRSRSIYRLAEECGNSRGVIARQLALSTKTVDEHLRRARRRVRLAVKDVL